MCGHYTTCVVFTTHLQHVQIVLENTHRCEKSHICGENPHTFGFTHICVGILWPVWFLSNTRDMKLGENNNKFVNHAMLKGYFKGMDMGKKNMLIGLG